MCAREHTLSPFSTTFWKPLHGNKAQEKVGEGPGQRVCRSWQGTELKQCHLMALPHDSSDGESEGGLRGGVETAEGRGLPVLWERETGTRGQMLRVFWHAFTSSPMGTSHAPRDACSSLYRAELSKGNWWERVLSTIF